MKFFLFSCQCIWCFLSQMCIYLFCTFVLAMFGQSVWNCCPTFVLGIAMFITAVCVLFLIKLRWPKKKSVWDKKCSKIKPKFYTSKVFCLYFYLFIYSFIYPNFKYVTVIHHVCTYSFLSFRRKPREKKARRETYCLHINLVLAICLSQICFVIGNFIISVNVVRIIPSGGFHPKQFQYICVKLVDA